MAKEKQNNSLNGEPSEILKKVKRFFTILLGMTVLIIGILMIVLPGPAIVFVPLGLTILATEYLWARVWLAKIKKKTQEIKDVVFKKK